jgi:2-dehydro-3-deoxygluconokinase
MAGLIYGLSSGHNGHDVISFAAAAAFGKLQEHGDATNNSVEQIQKILSMYEEKTTH